MVAWEVAIGRVRSACDFGVQHGGFGMSLWYYSLLRDCSIEDASDRFAKEIMLEKVRINKFPNAVSRLRGMYFFKSESDANAALDRWGVSRNGKYISQINFTATDMSEVDSEWITSCLKSEDAEWMERYWRGETYGLKPLTEVIASGIGTVQNKVIRQAAYWRIVEKFPESTPLLAMASCGFAKQGIESIAQIVPAISKKQSESKVEFHIYLNDLKSKENEIVEAVVECKKNNEFPITIPPKEPNSFFIVPDLSKGEFVFKEKKVREILMEVMARIRE